MNCTPKEKKAWKGPFTNSAKGGFYSQTILKTVAFLEKNYWSLPLRAGDSGVVVTGAPNSNLVEGAKYPFDGLNCQSYLRVALGAPLFLGVRKVLKH